jgi:hypothetical protein
MRRKFRSKNLKGREYSEDLGVDGRNFRETGWESVDLMHVAQNRDQRRAVVKTVMNLNVQ